jgi:TRAF3-interacting protein 1
MEGAEEVRQLLQPLFSKPALTDKLLSKPPFRFVHDVISGVTKATGFAEGLYADRPDLQDAKAIKEKQAKLDYIDRIVLCVGNFHGSPCDIKSGKVVAGLEPEKTINFFLELGKAAKACNAESSALAVQRAISNEQPDPAFANGGGGGGAKDEGGAKEEAMDAKAEAPGPSSAQAKPPPSRGGGQRNSSGAKDEVAPRAGGPEVMGHDEGPSYEAYIEECNGEIETTIKLMGELISKPKMTEKLLSKPPFRFLHDVMMAVTDATQFGVGLLEDSEKDGKVLSKASKEEKVEFLEKVKKLVGFSLNTMVEARPAKIVAGLEPENTNRLLQLLAVAAKHCPNSDRAVAMVRGGGDVEPTPQAAAAAPEPAAARESKPDAAEESAPTTAAPKPAATEQPAAAPAKDDGAKESSSSSSSDMGAPSSAAVAAGGGAKGGDDAKAGEEDGDNFLGDAEPKRSMRPTTARRRPPRVKENVKQLEQPGVGGGTSTNPSAAAELIIADGADLIDSDDEAEAKEGGLGDGLGGFGVVADQAEGASNLVREIENEARAGRGEMKEEESKNDSKGGIRLGRIKKSADNKTKKSMSSWSEQDIEQLRISVQRLCQSTNPLGKCMDFVHEDLTAMSKEYERWQTE